MAKAKKVFFCQECGAQRTKWEGQCRDCGAWNSFVEEIETAPTANSRSWDVSSKETQSIRLDQEVCEEIKVKRIPTGFEEIDRVLGGGLVPGSYILLGGDPGIGKSTLLMQMAGGLAKAKQEILYVSGEESVSQSALRAQRLGVHAKEVEVAAESQLDKILQMVKNKKPNVLIIDSIQTVYLNEISSAPGSVSQVRECAARLMSLAKSENISVFLIGHVTKDGHIAGPKVLEHMVDTVLSFEGDGHHHFRLLRALKNRFGATNELGVFQMDSAGLVEVKNPSELFLEERGADLIGSAIFSALEGSRPLLCEVQALTSPTPMAQPRRTSIGFDTQRVHLLVAVLEKHLELGLAKADIYINVVGGLKLTEPASDLAIAASLISSAQQQELNPKACFFGEIGLTGEIRAAHFAEERLREAKKLGFEYFILPKSNRKHLKSLLKEKAFENGLIWVDSVNQLSRVLTNLRPKTKNQKQPASLDL